LKNVRAVSSAGRDESGVQRTSNERQATPGPYYLFIIGPSAAAAVPVPAAAAAAADDNFKKISKGA